MRRPVKIALWLGGVLAALLLLSITAALLILPSQWFSEKVRERIVSETERATGGKVEIQRFSFDWRTKRAEVSQFVLRGTEPAGERPLFAADLVQVDLELVSMLRKDIRLASALVDRPRLNLLVGKNGITNLPVPRVRRGNDGPIVPLLKIAIRRILLREGEFRYGDQRLPIHLNGERLNAALNYVFPPLGVRKDDSHYDGELSFEKLSVDAPPVLPLAAALHTKFQLFRNSIAILGATARTRTAQVEASGRIDDFQRVRVALQLKANGSLTELGKPLRLPQPHVGNVQFVGDLRFDQVEKLRIDGHVTGQGLAVKQPSVSVQNIAVASAVSLTENLVRLTKLRVDALDGRFDGSADIKRYRQYYVTGKVSGLSLQALANMAAVRGESFAGIVSGPVEIQGSFDPKLRDVLASGKLDVKAGASGVPVQGFVEAAYNQRQQTLQLGNSFLVLPSSRIDFNGTVGSQLNTRVESRNLGDFAPILSAFGNSTPLPVRLTQGGQATFEGSVTGQVADARIAGTLALIHFEVQKQTVDTLRASLVADRTQLQLSTFAAGQQQLKLEGSGRLSLQDWRVTDTSGVNAKLRIEGAQLSKLIADAGQKIPVEGLLSATAEVSGTTGDPRFTGRIDVAKPVLYGEGFDRVTGGIAYAGDGVDFIDGSASIGATRVQLSGRFAHPRNDWTNGTLSVDVATRGYSLESIKNLRRSDQAISGQFNLTAKGLLEVRKGSVLPQRLDGELAMSNFVWNGRSLGDFNTVATTTGEQLTYRMTANVRGTKLSGTGTARLAGDFPASGEIDIAPVRVGVLQDLLLAQDGQTARVPVRGSLEGKLSFAGPARKPEQISAKLVLNALRIAPTRAALPQEQSLQQQLTLENDGPVEIDYLNRIVSIKNAHMVGRDTDLRVAGNVALESKSNYDLRVNGTLNLAVISDINSDVVSRGVAQLGVAVKGPLQDPTIAGRLELQKATFSIAGLPNGIENATGTILFDKQRATVEKLTAQTGGGNITFGGFVGFGGGELLYQLQARTDRVRIRYPEGVSTTANAVLRLTGTPDRSQLAGVVTIARAAFNPRTDVGGLLASSATPGSGASISNPFLRGMQLDVRVETMPNVQVQSSLTQDLQMEANLQIRGTPVKPVVLGRAVVHQGDIQFFGNRYTINRGEIGFFNPVKLEPVLDMDLETRVRGVLVNITFSGTLSRLNVSYRSDPPLQSSEIIALLAVGRVPGSNSALASGQTITNQGIQASGGNSLLGSAVAAPVSSRLQRFFGVSRLKIDPLLTGVNAVPQARLTIEQQISRDITLTYITNLSEANQQIIRLEWDISRSWSVVALREENGVFGIDFFFKKRLR